MLPHIGIKSLNTSALCSGSQIMLDFTYSAAGLIQYFGTVSSKKSPEM